MLYSLDSRHSGSCVDSRDRTRVDRSKESSDLTASLRCPRDTCKFEHFGIIDSLHDCSDCYSSCTTATASLIEPADDPGPPSHSGPGPELHVSAELERQNRHVRKLEHVISVLRKWLWRHSAPIEDCQLAQEYARSLPSRPGLPSESTELEINSSDQASRTDKMTRTARGSPGGLLSVGDTDRLFICTQARRLRDSDTVQVQVTTPHGELSNSPR